MVKSKGRSGSPDRGLIDKLTGERAETLNEVGVAWLKGTKIDWQELYAKYLKDSNQERFRIPLPTYPFERERYWIDVGPLELFNPDPGVQMERMNNRVEMEPGEAVPVEEEVSAGLYARPPLSTEYVAPGNEVEQALVGVWQKFFGIREVGIYDDFFELGGDSLRAITVVTEIHKRMDTRVPITEIFQSPTIKKLAEYIKGTETDKYSAIEPVEEREYFPLSSVQRRMYILQQININSTGYNDTLIFEVEGQLDKDHLVKVFNNLVTRHESLRTSFQLIDEEHVQRIHREIEFMVDFYDLSAETSREAPIKERQIIQQFVRPFDLSQASLLRVGLIRRNEEKHVLMTDMHHIITDGSSIGILVREFMTLYTGGPLPCFCIQYKDYTQWQNSDKQREVIKRQEAYWLKVFEDEIPVLNFPSDYVRPATMSFEGSKKAFEMNREETEALKKVASAQDATLFMILLSVYNVMLAKICVQEDIVVGIPIAGRTHADLQNVIGMLVNTLAVRNYPSKEKTFREFLKEVRENTLAAFENQDYLFEDLVEQLTENAKLNRDTSRNPVFDTLFNLLNIQSQYEANLEIKSPGVSLMLYEHQKEASVFDLVFQGSEEQNGLLFTVEFRTHLFKPETIHRLFGYFRRIAAAVAASPDIRISEIEIISGEEKRILLIDFNDTAVEYPRDKTIHELFEEQAEKSPDGIAVVDGGWHPQPIKKRKAESVESVGAQGTVLVPMNHVSITYKELNEKSNQLAQLLRTKGVGPDVIVGIIMERSVGLIIGLLGILKAGGAYLPIDPQYPQGRIDFMLKDSNARILLAAPAVQVKVEAEVKEVSTELINISKEFPSSTSTLTLTCQIGSANLAYVIYTSGTTGTPRGVLIRHRGVINMVNCNRGVFGEAPGERVSQAASPSFDAMGFEVWPCLLSGAALCIADNEVRANPVELKDWLIKEGINISFQPTIMAEELLEEEWPKQGVCLRVLRTAGDRLKKYPARSYPFFFYNLYGPTEDTVWTTWTEVEVKTKAAADMTKYPTIGKPIDNHRVYILSSSLRLQPIGVSGELCIAGEGLSVGYLNNPELTAEKFDRDLWDFHDDHDEKRKENYQKFFGGARGAILPKSAPGRRRLYKTGDLARWLQDGNIEFLGRLDHQVKVRGYRLELGEIENYLMAMEGIKDAVVITRGGENDEKYLCAYVVTKNESDINVSLLRQELSTRLPDFMIPSRFMKIDKIPLTPNNKVDHKALPDPEISRPQLESGYLAPVTGMEKLITDTWQEVLNLDKIGINDNFFDLGGNSLSLVKVIVKLRKILKREIPTLMMLQYPTVHLLAQHIMEEEEKQNKISAAEKKDQLEKLDKGKERLKATRNKMK
ncbi:MAG: amino acid adenylation domain-containing protein [Candidatus Aminicenantes bacterium]|nr:amino acid adenylation domain-containing protein [Candidatus Aminicenantes bacterium]NIM79559.1 amino acid adenylation domain-containing protein [Candidatus Aminicenantes bacterium]NIN23153.1 amino acid adenylation domain-containing protein [Candidatus Aminicenantes bacterium]NIN46880.1 amino acid adenylation domain-containing protein [Candidatus Aminicenantes bacterium]NIN89802.1 amino acid adenylation domain-containing protein [Candidatus Aminicenantes bacterium]